MSSGTAAVAAPNEALIRQFDPVRDYFVKIAGDDKFMREVSFAAQILGGNDYLRKTSVESQQLALTGLAESGLTLSPIEKLAYLVPRKGKCVLEPSYMGLVKLLTDAGSVRHIEARPIYEGDQCEIDMASDKKVMVHTPYFMRGLKKGVVRGFYSIATLVDGSKHAEMMGKDEVDRIMERSESYKAYRAGTIKSTTWVTDYEEMGRKTVVRRHWKSLPKTERMEHIAKAIDLDHQDFVQHAPQLAAPVDSRVTAQEALRDKVRAALKGYKGADKKAIAKSCSDQAKSGEINPQFWEDMLRRIENPQPPTEEPKKDDATNTAQG